MQGATCQCSSSASEAHGADPAGMTQASAQNRQNFFSATARLLVVLTHMHLIMCQSWNCQQDQGLPRRTFKAQAQAQGKLFTAERPCTHPNP
jgi:hypothetical protein